MIPVDGHSMVPVNEDSFEVATEALLEPTRLLERVLDVLEAYVVVLDEHGEIVLFNRACERVVEQATEDLLGQSFVEALVPLGARAEVQARLDRMFADSSVRRVPQLWIGTDREQRRIRWTATRVDGEHDAALGVVLTGVDATRELELEREVVSVDEEIRQQFGAELHDMLASHLAGTAMMASALTRKAEKGEAVRAGDLRRLTELVRDAMEQVRALSHSFVAPELESDDLVEALDQLANRTEVASGVYCSCSVCGTSRSVVPTGEAATHLYRIAQEALHNAVTHADPSQIEISLVTKEDDTVGEVLVLTVQDDGCGVSVGEEDEEGVGLRNMQRRARLMNALLEVEPIEEGGTRVRCVLPLSSDGPKA